MEAFAVASNAAGLVSLAIQVCKGLLTYYQSLRSAESDVLRMYNSIESLTKTSILLESVIQNDNFDRQIVENVEKSVLSTQNGIRSLGKKLDKIKLHQGEKDGWVEKAKTPLRKVIYPLKQSVLVKLQELANELRDDLALALNVLQVDASAVALERLNLLSDQVLDISDGVTYLTGGVDSVSFGVKSLQATAAITANGVDTLLSLQERRPPSPSPLACEFGRKHHELVNLEGRQDGIAKWLTGTEQFDHWIAGTGAGKTVLSSLMIEHLLRRTKEEQGAAVAYLYCNYSEVEKQTVSNLLSCLVSQLHSQQPRAFMREAIAGTDSSLANSVTLLRTAISGLANVFIVIDALDEIPEEDGRRKTLISELSSLTPVVQLLVISRDLPNIRRQLNHAIHVEIEANEGDIMNYIDSRIAGFERLSTYITKDASLGRTIRTAVASKACGMFLQAKFHIDSLATKTTLRKLKDTLSALPDGLTKAYDEIMQRISVQSKDNYQLALKILCWVVHAITPLNLLMIRQALAVEDHDTSLDVDNMPDEDLLVTVCQGLINVHRDTGFVGFVHHTTKEYFNCRRLELFPEAHTYVLRTCLTYLSFDEFGDGMCLSWKDFEGRVQDHPFLAYAAQYWGFHANRSRYGQECETPILDFLTKHEHLQHSVLVTSIWQLPSSQDLVQQSNVSPLHIAAHFGMEKIMQTLLRAGAEPMATTSWGRNPLHMALNEDVATLLLQSGAHVDSQDIAGDTPLMRHSWVDSVGVVQKLLESGADMKTTSNAGNAPIHYAAGNRCESAARMLLDFEADANAQNQFTGNTPLHIAAMTGDNIMTKLLLSRGASLNSRNVNGETPLMVAALGKHDAVTATLLQWLIGDGSDEQCTAAGQVEASRAKECPGVSLALDEVDVQGRTALAAGLRWRYTARLLLYGANPNIVDKQGRNCLHHAAARGSSQSVTRLLTERLDPNLADKDGWTPLFWAAKEGKIDNLRVLMDAGADPTITLENQLNIFSVTTYHGHGSLLPLLYHSLDSRDIDNHDPTKDTALLPGIWRNGYIKGALSFAICDGCELDIYGPRYKCTVCPDFDFCFKCVATAKDSHAPHDFLPFSQNPTSLEIWKEAVANDAALLASSK